MDKVGFELGETRNCNLHGSFIGRESAGKTAAFVSVDLS